MKTDTTTGSYVKSLCCTCVCMCTILKKNIWTEKSKSDIVTIIFIAHWINDKFCHSNETTIVEQNAQRNIIFQCMSHTAPQTTMPTITASLAVTFTRTWISAVLNYFCVIYNLTLFVDKLSGSWESVEIMCDLSLCISLFLFLSPSSSPPHLCIGLRDRQFT